MPESYRSRRLGQQGAPARAAPAEPARRAGDPEHFDPVGPAEEHRRGRGVVVEDGRVGVEDDGAGIRTGR